MAMIYDTDDTKTIFSLVTELSLAQTKDFDSAEEVTQNAMLKLLLSRRRPKQVARSWLHVLVRHCAHDLFRALKRYNRLFDGTMYVAEDGTHDDRYVVVPAYEPKYVEMLNLNEVMEQLSLAHRLVLQMHADGYSYEEIAAHCQIPIGTVRSRLYHARAHARRLLTSGG
jgi:RNA polymerase sigma-70 factor (ECF subfamily)